MRLSRFISAFLAAFLLLIAAQASASSSSSASSVGGVSVSVTDGKNSINAGGSLIYAITVRNTASISKTVDIVFEVPQYASTVSPDQGGVYAGGLVRWENTFLSSNQSVTYTVQLNLDPLVPQGTVLRGTASAAGVSASDTTTVGSVSANEKLFDVSISDGKSTARPDDLLTYTITVKNLTDDTRTADVRLGLGTFLVFQESDPASTQNGSTTTWSSVSFSDNAVKTFTVKARVLRSAPDYYLLTAQAYAGDASATDTASVLANNGSSSRKSSSSSRSSTRSSSSSARTNVSFSVVPDSSEVVPGGRVRFTLTVRNSGNTTVDDAIVQTRYDSSVVTLIDAGGSVGSGASEIQWILPPLAAGRTWTTSIMFGVSNTAANGAAVSLVSTLEGEDIRTITLDSRTQIAGVTVIGELPSTGFPLDMIALFGVTSVAGASALMQRKIRN